MGASCPTCISIFLEAFIFPIYIVHDITSWLSVFSSLTCHPDTIELQRGLVSVDYVTYSNYFDVLPKFIGDLHALVVNVIHKYFPWYDTYTRLCMCDSAHFAPAWTCDNAHVTRRERWRECAFMHLHASTRAQTGRRRARYRTFTRSCMCHIRKNI